MVGLVRMGFDALDEGHSIVGLASAGAGWPFGPTGFVLDDPVLLRSLNLVQVGPREVIAHLGKVVVAA